MWAIYGCVDIGGVDHLWQCVLILGMWAICGCVDGGVSWVWAIYGCVLILGVWAIYGSVC